MVAVVCPMGRYIYVIDLSIRRVVAELFRGRKQCEVRSISFSFDNNYLALITNKCKINLFNIENVTRSKEFQIMKFRIS